MLDNGDYTVCLPVYEAYAWDESLGKDYMRPCREPFCRSTGRVLPASLPWQGAGGHHWAVGAALLQLTLVPTARGHLEIQEKAVDF